MPNHGPSALAAASPPLVAAPPSWQMPWPPSALWATASVWSSPCPWPCAWLGPAINLSKFNAEWNTRIVSMSLESLVSFDVCGMHVSSRSASALRLVNLRILFFPWDHFRRLDPCKLSLANGRPIPASERYHYIDIL